MWLWKLGQVCFFLQAKFRVAVETVTFNGWIAKCRNCKMPLIVEDFLVPPRSWYALDTVSQTLKVNRSNSRKTFKTKNASSPHTNVHAILFPFAFFCLKLLLFSIVWYLCNRSHYWNCIHEGPFSYRCLIYPLFPLFYKESLLLGK